MIISEEKTNFNHNRIPLQTTLQVVAIELLSSQH